MRAPGAAAGGEAGEPLRRGQGDASLTPEGGGHMVLRKDEVEIRNSGWKHTGNKRTVGQSGFSVAKKKRGNGKMPEGSVGKAGASGLGFSGEAELAPSVVAGRIEH